MGDYKRTMSAKKRKLTERYETRVEDLSKAAPVDYSYRQNIWKYYRATAIQVIVAVIIGFIVNALAFWLQKWMSMPAWLAIIVQLILLVTVFYFVERRWHTFAETWQSTTPGFVFVAVVTGIQFNMWNNLGTVGKQVGLIQT